MANENVLSGKYTAYPEYKDTGIAWLATIPENWQVLPLKLVLANKVKDGPHETPKFLDEGIPFFSVDGIQNCKLIFEGCRYISQEDHDRFSMKCLPKFGDVLLGKAASVGKVAFVDTKEEFNVWSPLAVLTPKSVKLGKFIFYSLQSTWLQAQCDVNSNSNTQKNLSMGVIDNLSFAIPSDTEADTIANFLDHETAKIDTLIEKQQQLIKLLKEKRQAVISHAVTKGLNPIAPMRDSGVEWLGEVPAHWIPIQIRRILSDMEQGKSPECESREAESNEWGVLKTSCVNRAIYNSLANKALPNTIKPFPQYEVKKGDILMSRASGSRDLIGSVAYVYETRPRILLSDKIFRLHLSSRVNRIFFSFLMQSSYMRSNIERAISGAEGMANNITKSAVIGFCFALPPKDEQNDIAELVTKKLNVFDELIKKSNSAIEIMKERRTALISAAVTGKIDVRNWQAQHMSNIAKSNLLTQENN